MTQKYLAIGVTSSGVQIWPDHAELIDTRDRFDSILAAPSSLLLQCKSYGAPYAGMRGIWQLKGQCYSYWWCAGIRRDWASAIAKCAETCHWSCQPLIEDGDFCKSKSQQEQRRYFNFTFIERSIKRNQLPRIATSSQPNIPMISLLIVSHSFTAIPEGLWSAAESPAIPSP